MRLPLPLVVLEPGPATDVAKLIQIASPTYQSKGSFLLTTVLVTSTEGVTLPDAVRTVLDPDAELVSRETIFPSDSTRINTNRVHAAQMTESQEAAAVAALHELGRPSKPEGAFIREVAAEAPAARLLRPGDVVLAVEGKPVADPATLLKALEGHEAGERVTVTFRRGEKVREVRIETIGAEKGARARLGIVVIPKHEIPLDISIDAGNIGGPSAGLVFGLAIYDSLTPGDLTRGRKIAGTGAIVNAKDRFGRVEAVGGVGEKVRASSDEDVDVFLVPESNIEEARSSAPDGLRVVGVKTLGEAIRELGG